MEALAKALIAWIVAATVLAAPEPPRIEFVPKQELVERAFEANHGEVRLRVDALYDRDQEVVYLPEHWDGNDIGQVGALLHELVHHVQKFNKVKGECPAANERLAYDLQLAWLRERGVQDPYTLLKIDEFTIWMITRCRSHE
jgi:hypothetical protein